MALEHLQTQTVCRAGQISSAGSKKRNEDCIGLRLPEGALLTTKGIAMVIADGVSAATGGQEASHSAVTGFLSDYYSTPDTWSTPRSVQQVLLALNSWLYGRNLNSHTAQLTYLTTLTVVIVKSRVAHIFHVGDCRLHLYRDGELSQLTRDHCAVTREGSHLTRALGMDHSLDIDYRQWMLEPDDLLISTTDGIHDWLSTADLLAHCKGGQGPEELCQSLLVAAQAAGSDDNLSAQALHVEALSLPSAEETYLALAERAFPPPLDPGQRLDGMIVEKELHGSERSQVYRVRNEATGEVLVMKTPSVNYEDDPSYIERFALEQWMGSRLNNPHVVRVFPQPENTRFLYYLTEYLPGPTLEEVIRTQAPLDVATALNLLEEMIRGLRAFHRRDMLHQDVKPANVILTDRGAVWVDFGSATARGIAELESSVARDIAQGTARYSAPEVHAGHCSTVASEQFSLGVILYELLTRQHPFGEAYGDRGRLRKHKPLRYQTALEYNPLVPHWLDAALERCLSVDPEARYPALSHWLADLRNPRIARQPFTLVEGMAKRPSLGLKLLLAASVMANGVLVWVHWGT